MSRRPARPPRGRTDSRAGSRRAAGRRASARRPPPARVSRSRARARPRGPSPARRGSRAASPRSSPRAASAEAAARKEAGPPCSTVSAAPTVTTASVSTSARLTGVPSPASIRPGSSASCTDTSPRNRSAKSGVTRLSITRLPGRRASPAATSRVWRSVGTPIRSSSSEAAAIAAWRGSRAAPGIGSAGGSTRIVARPPRGTTASSGSPTSGKPQRVPDGRTDVGDRLARRRGRCDRDGALAALHDDETRAVEDREARH